MRLVVFAALALAGTAQAQDYPSTTVRFIVSAPPGVLSDTLPRGMLEPLRQALGKPVVIDNRPGADGLIAAEACARAGTDGHSVCVSGGTMMTLNPVMRPKIPYDPIKDFSGVMLVGYFDSLLLVHADNPATSVAQLLDLARAKPNSIVWGHFGRTTTGYLYGEWLKKGRGVPFYEVPYKTQPQAMQALLTGEAQAGVFSWTTVLSHVKSGKLKALAVTADKRLEFLPNVPTFEAEGIRLPLRPWFGYHVVAGTPRPIIARLNQEMRKIVTDGHYKEGILDKLGIAASPGSPEDLDAFVREQLRQASEMYKSLGLKPLTD